MSKNELNVIARIVLIGVGLYVVLQIFLNILGSLATMQLIASAKADMPMIIIVFGMYVIITLAAVYFLFRCSNRLSAKIVGSESADDTQVSWLAVAFRLVCVTAGVLFLFWSLPRLVVTLSMYMNTEQDQQYIFTSMQKGNIIEYVVLLGLSIYLFCGAPGFVRWQVKKTLKQCSKYEEQKPPWH